jgi:serine/threonine protein kinase
MENILFSKPAKNNQNKIIYKPNSLEKWLTHLDTKETLLNALKEIHINFYSKHPNLITLNSIELKEHSTLLIRLKFLKKGTNLYDFRCQINSNFPKIFLKTIGFQLLRGLGYLHLNGVFHRNLHLGNVFIDVSTFEVKLFDFGRLRKEEEDFRATPKGYERDFKCSQFMNKKLLKKITSAKKKVLVKVGENQSSSKLKGKMGVKQCCSLSEKGIKFNGPSKTLLKKRNEHSNFSKIEKQIPILKKISDSRLSKASEVDLKQNIFSMGQILFFLSTGKYFYRSSQPLKHILQVVQGIRKMEDNEFTELVNQYERFEEIMSLPEDQMPSAAKDLICQCLRFDPADRPGIFELLNHDFFKEFSKGVLERLNKSKDIPRFDVEVDSVSQEDLLGRIRDFQQKLQVRLSKV